MVTWLRMMVTDGDMLTLPFWGGSQDPDWYTKVHPQRKNAEHMAGSCGSTGAGNV